MHPPPPLHRWKTLWFGLLTLIFLFWAWHRSHRHYDQIGFTAANRSWSILSENSTLSLFVLHPAGHGTNYEPRQPSQPIVFQHIRHGPVFTARICQIAWWLILPLYIIAWTALLLWHSHRIKVLSTHQQHLTASPESQAPQERIEP